MLRVLVLFVFLPVLLACGPVETGSGVPDPDAVYRLISIDGTTVAYEATLQFPQVDRITGQAPCNRYSAAQLASFPDIEIEAIAATRMACPDLASTTWL